MNRVVDQGAKSEGNSSLNRKPAKCGKKLSRQFGVRAVRGRRLEPECSDHAGGMPFKRLFTQSSLYSTVVTEINLVVSRCRKLWIQWRGRI